MEADRLAAMRAAVASGALKPARGAEATPLFVVRDDAPAETPALLGVKNRACVFFEADHGHLCAVQRALGHDALPLACRQFPRVSLRDPRGVSVTLSHYCPTAASLLGAPARVDIVTEAPAFPAGGEYSGLDATGVLPPLLRADVLMDWDSWWLLEALAVDLIGNADGPAEDALPRLATAVGDLAAWRPADGPLSDRVRDAMARARSQPVRAWRPSSAWLASRVELALASIPADLRDAAPDPSPDTAALAPILLKQYLAAHAFANWTAVLGPGLMAWQRSIEVPYALVQSGWNVRGADLILRHLVDPARFASACGPANPV